VQRVRLGLLCFVLSLSACGSCKKKPEPAPTPAASASASSSAPAGSALLLEKFLDAHALEGGFEVAAIARDRTVVRAVLDANLAVKQSVVLARDVEAVEGTDVSLASSGPSALIVVTAKIGGTRGTWLLRENAAPRTIGIEHCRLRDGFAWLERDGESTRIKVVRANGELESPVIVVPADREAHLTCGATAVVLSMRDGENLSTSTWTMGSAPTPLAEAEKEGVLDDELRERLTLVRDSGDLVLLRVGEKSVSIREGSGPWIKLVTGKEKAFALGEDVDVIEGAAAPDSKGRVFMLASEPAQGECSDGDPPRRIVLHTIDPSVKEGSSVTTKPIIELPCGTEAIAAHLTAEPTRARMWWTEPVDAKTCNQKGLPIAAVVTASSDGPAKPSRILAEGVAQIDANRFLAVVRPGGCVPYEQPGNGALALVK
jgi:hypothetical protein